MKVLITGDRNWTDREAVRLCLTELRHFGYDTIIQGHARGADQMAAFEGKLLGFRVLTLPAQWERYGRAAGPIRNREMVKVGEPNLVVYFHHNLSESKGTRDMVNYAISCGIKVINGSL